MDEGRSPSNGERMNQMLKARLESKETCSEVIDAGEEVLSSAWVFMAQLLGEAGATAVLVRSIQLAMRTSPMVRKVRPLGRGVDFGELRQYVDEVGYTRAEVLEAFLRLGEMLFQTLSDLTGEVLTEPLLRHLQGK